MSAPVPVLKQFTQQQIDDIKALYESGKTDKEIGKKYNATRRTIAKLRKAIGVISRSPKQAQKSRFDPDFVKKVTELRLSGLSMPEIVAKIGRSLSAVGRVCQKYGLEAIDDTPKIDMEEFCRLYRGGWNMRSSLLLNMYISVALVRRILVNGNVELRKTKIEVY